MEDEIPRKRGKRKPAETPEASENQLVALAIDLVERQLKEGSASAQVISHYLKIGSTRGKLEEERLVRENELLKAKVESLASGKRVEELYEAAIQAMRRYAGQDVDDHYDD